MARPREQQPYGYDIGHSNNPEHPCWLVLRWGKVLKVCEPRDESLGSDLAALTAAYQWLYDRLEAGCVG